MSETIYFDAELTPNRALSPKAFLIIMGLVGGVSFIAGLSFLRLGAFPVLGFFGLDALLIWLAFRASFRGQSQRTQIKITADRIDLRHQTAGRPDKTACLPTAFTRVELVLPDRKTSELRLSHARTTLRIGAFLAPSERRTLKRALEKAIYQARNERYASE